MLEALRKTVAGHAVRVMLCGCESCGHVWLAAEPSGPPARCARCKARTWRGEAGERWEPRRKTSTGPRRARSRLTQEEPKPVPQPEAKVSAMPDRASHAATPAVQPPEPDPVRAIRCKRCGALCMNSFALRIHDCQP